MNIIKKSFFFLLLSVMSISAEQLTDSFRLDGYTNINMYSADKKHTDKFNLSGGLQGRYQITNTISATGQIHLKEGLDSVSNPITSSFSIPSFKNALRLAASFTITISPSYLAMGNSPKSSLLISND